VRRCNVSAIRLLRDVNSSGTALPCWLHVADEDSTDIRRMTGFVADETGPYEPQPKFNVAAQMFEARLNLSSDPHSSNRRV
jgi:hypothetical protein